MRRHRQGGDAALAAVARQGSPSRLSDEQWEEVLSWLPRSPLEFGYPTELWTSKRVADPIEKHFGVRYNFRYISGWLKRQRISPRKPAEAAGEAADAAIARWLAEEWPRILKKRPSTPPMWCGLTRAGRCWLRWRGGRWPREAGRR
jgi:transposase